MSTETEAKTQCAIEEMERSHLFDLTYYAKQLAESGVIFPDRHSAMLHYVQHGAANLFSPHLLFDPKWYLERNALVLEADVPALLHYVRSSGVQAYTPHPVFDAKFYVASYPDFRGVESQFLPLSHFVLVGNAQARSPHPLFDMQYYLSQQNVSDLSDVNLLEDYLLRGYKLDLRPHEFFDPAFYRNQFDGESHKLIENISPLVHFLKFGSQHSVDPHPFFDRQYYRKQLIASNVELGKESLFMHFLTAPSAVSLSPNSLFDARFYLKTYPDIEAAKCNAFIHYLKCGAYEQRHPSRRFDTIWYLSKHPDVAAKRINPLLRHAELLRCGRDASDPFSPITEAYAFESEVESRSLIGLAAVRASGLAPTAVDEAFDLMMDFARDSFTHLVIVPGMLRGGAERAACSYISYLQETQGIENVVMLSTEYDSHSVTEWLPQGTRKFDVKNCLSTPLSVNDIIILVTAFIVATKPRMTIATNSICTFWAMYRYKEILSEHTKFVLLLFGFESYFQKEHALLEQPYFRDSVEWADYVITDTKRLNEYLRVNLDGRRRIGKMTTECYLSSHHLERLKAIRRSVQPAQYKTLLWASRVVPSKRPDILIKVASLLPEYKFLVYGSIESLRFDSSLPNYLDQFSQMENIEYRGEYSDFAEICNERIGAFIYTSDSDGVPITLLEAAAAGIPIIAPNVGGIGEFVTNESGWLIEDFTDVNSYVQAIETIFDDGDSVILRTEMALNTLNERHSQEAFKRRLDLIFGNVIRIP